MPATTSITRSNARKSYRAAHKDFMRRGRTGSWNRIRRSVRVEMTVMRRTVVLISGIVLTAASAWFWQQADMSVKPFAMATTLLLLYSTIYLTLSDAGLFRLRVRRQYYILSGSLAITNRREIIRLPATDQPDPLVARPSSKCSPGELGRAVEAIKAARR